MGTILDGRIRHPIPVEKEAGPREVGAIHARQKCSATIIGKPKGSDRWCYCGELEIYVWPLKYHERALGGRASTGPGDILLWAGMEVKLEVNADNQRWRGKHLIAALTNPVSQNWVGCAAFRSPLHRGREQILGGLREALHREVLRREMERRTAEISAPQNEVAQVWGESALPEALRTLPYDPFETDKDWLTARLPDPLRFRWPQVEAVGDDYSLARNPLYRDGPKPPKSTDRRNRDRDGDRQNRSIPRWSFGICADLETARKEIREEALRNDRLLELPGRPGGPSHSAVLEATEGLIETAIWQALAGRTGGERSVPVVHRVVRYVHDHMEAASKRFEGKPRGVRAKQRVGRRTDSPEE